jgi:hypothetical protein
LPPWMTSGNSKDGKGDKGEGDKGKGKGNI